MKVIIDYRERRSGVVKELMKKGIEVEEKQLVVGDFVLQGEGLEGRLETIGIEKKTQHDFINSIIDKRIIRQLIELKENFNIPLLIIEGRENIYSLRNFHPNAIRGMLAAIAIDYQIPIIYSKNYRDTASLIQVIMNRLKKPRRHLGLLRKRKPLTLKEQQELLVESLPGIGPTLSKNLLLEFKTVKNLVNAGESRLKKVEKIGPKKAELIRRVFYDNYSS